MESTGRTLRFKLMIPGEPITAHCTTCGKQFTCSEKDHNEEVLGIRAMFAEHICEGLFKVSREALYRKPS